MEIKRILRLIIGAIVISATVVSCSVITTLFFSQGIGYDLSCELVWEYPCDDFVCPDNYNESFFTGTFKILEGHAFGIKLSHLTVNTTYRWCGNKGMYPFIANETTHYFWMVLYKGEVLEFQRLVMDNNALGQQHWEYLTLIKLGLV